jgi:hypothetical protein
MSEFQDDMDQIERAEAVAVALAVLARPVTSADLPAAAALDMLANAPALLEEAMRRGVGARVAFWFAGTNARGEICDTEGQLAAFFRAANERGAKSPR